MRQFFCSLNFEPHHMTRMVSQVRNHPYITSAKGLGGWVWKMANFSDIQYCVYAVIVGGWVKKIQNYADVI